MRTNLLGEGVALVYSDDSVVDGVCRGVHYDTKRKGTLTLLIQTLDGRLRLCDTAPPGSAFVAKWRGVVVRPRFPKDDKHEVIPDA